MRSSSFPRPTAGFGFAGNENCRESSAVLAPKKEGPPLGMGAPEGAFQLLASFSHQRVGSSITCFPLRGRWERSAKSDKQAPSPRLSLPTFRHLKRAHAAFLCKASANVAHQGPPHKYLLMFKLASPYVHPQTPNLH